MKVYSVYFYIYNNFFYDIAIKYSYHYSVLIKNILDKICRIM